MITHSFPRFFVWSWVILYVALSMMETSTHTGLSDTQIYCQQTPDETVFISAIETVRGIKAIMVPIGPNSLVAVESRRALGT